MTWSTDFMEYDDLAEANAAVEAYNKDERERTGNAMGSVATLDYLDTDGPYVIHVDNINAGRSGHGDIGNHCMYVH